MTNKEKFDKAIKDLNSLGYYPHIWHVDDARHVSTDAGLELDEDDIATAMEVFANNDHYIELGNEVLENIILNNYA